MPVVRNAMNDPDPDVKYAATLSLLELAGESWLEREITRIAALLANDVRQDPRKRFSTEQFLEAVESMKDFARRRSAFVLEEVARARRGR